MPKLTSVSDIPNKMLPFLLGQTYRHIPALDGPLTLMFCEPSTRTRFSFDIAARDAGLTPLHFDVLQSSEQKGETTLDTCRNLMWMGVCGIVIRTSENGLPGRLAEHLDIPIINAGDGTNEHPTQALADACAIRCHYGRVEGLKVAIVGDIQHSRVARSNLALLTQLGAEVRLVGPEHLDLQEGLANTDVVMVLRWQRERERGVHVAGWAGSGPVTDNLVSKYRISKETLAFAKPTAVVLHPGPINYEQEITREVAEGPRSLVSKQVLHGVRVRTRILQWLLAP